MKASLSIRDSGAWIATELTASLAGRPESEGAAMSADFGFATSHETAICIGRCEQAKSSKNQVVASNDQEAIEMVRQKQC
jgi:hypothetical protein